MSIAKYKDELIKNARYLCQKGKGLLAADESTKTCGKRLESIEVQIIKAYVHVVNGKPILIVHIIEQFKQI